MALYLGQTKIDKISVTFKKIVSGENGEIVENGELATPIINESTGLITSGVSKAGYIDIDETNTLQLATQNAKIITPSSSSQIAVNSKKYVIGDIIVAAVPTETKTITSNGEYTPISGKYFSSITVNVPTNSNENFITQEKIISPTEAQQIITPDIGYDGLSSVTVNAIPNDYIGTNVIIQKYYTGNAEPSSSLGNNGDIYLKMV